MRGADDEIAVVRNISDHLDSMGYHDDRVIIDLSIARGLSYYTGPAFEAVAIDAPELGSILGVSHCRRGRADRPPAVMSGSL